MGDLDERFRISKRDGMTWSDRFRAYVEGNFETRQAAAFSLKVSPSKVHYWCVGSTPREETQKKIARWSKGAVPVETSTARQRTGTDG